MGKAAIHLPVVKKLMANEPIIKVAKSNVSFTKMLLIGWDLRVMAVRSKIRLRSDDAASAIASTITAYHLFNRKLSNLFMKIMSTFV